MPTTFKNIRIKMKGGKSRTQRVKVLASGKYKFVKNLPKGAGTRSKSSKPTKSRSKPRMAKNKGGGGKKAFGTIGWKGAFSGTAILAVLRILVNRLTGGGVPGEYVDSVSLVGAGVIGKATGIGTAHLLMPGIVLGASKLIEDIVSPNGLYTLPTLGGQGGGTDF